MADYFCCRPISFSLSLANEGDKLKEALIK